MDLYEALKAGTSAEDLLNKFNEELGAAQARIEAEEAEEKDAYREDCRNDLIDAFLDYIDACFGDELDEDELSPDYIEQILLDFEKEVKNLAELEQELDTLSAQLKKSDKPTVKVTYSLNDEDIIQAFLKSLKD